MWARRPSHASSQVLTIDAFLLINKNEKTNINVHELFLCVIAIQSAAVTDTWNRKCMGTSASGDNPLWIILIYTVISIVEAHLDHSNGHPNICYSFMIATIILIVPQLKGLPFFTHLERSVGRLDFVFRHLRCWYVEIRHSCSQVKHGL